MKTIRWKRVLSFGISTIIIMIVVIISTSCIQTNTQPTQTNIVDIKSTKTESTSIVLPTIAEKSTPTLEKIELRPSSTSLPTYTKIPTLEKMIIKSSTPSNTPSQVSGIGISIPTNTHVNYPSQQPTEIIKTLIPILPMPTDTLAPQISVTCGVIPNTIPGGTYTTQIYWAQFSPGDYGFGIMDIFYEISGSGQRSCNAGSDADGYASCEASAGMLPYVEKIKVTIRTSVRDCITYLYISKN